MDLRPFEEIFPENFFQNRLATIHLELKPKRMNLIDNPEVDRLLLDGMFNIARAGYDREIKLRELKKAHGVFSEAIQRVIHGWRAESTPYQIANHATQQNIWFQQRLLWRKLRSHFGDEMITYVSSESNIPKTVSVIEAYVGKCIREILDTAKVNGYDMNVRGAEKPALKEPLRDYIHKIFTHERPAFEDHRTWKERHAQEVRDSQAKGR